MIAMKHEFSWNNLILSIISNFVLNSCEFIHTFRNVIYQILSKNSTSMLDKCTEWDMYPHNSREREHFLELFKIQVDEIILP